MAKVSHKVTKSPVHGQPKVNEEFLLKAIEKGQIQTWYQQRGGIVDIGERDLSSIDIYAPLLEKGAA